MTNSSTVDAAGPLHRRILDLETQVTQLRGNLSLADEGLANYAQEVERLTRARDEYKVWWERDSTSLGKALNEVSSLRAGKEQFRAQIEQLHAAVKTAQELAATRLMEITQLRGNLSLAEEGLANYAQEIQGAHHDIDRLMAACNAEANEVERLREFIEKRCVGAGPGADAERWRLIDEWRKAKATPHEPGVGVSFDEHDRYKRCLYRANGRLIQLGQEPEKLDYPSTDKCGIAATSGDDVLTPDPTTRPECRTGGVSALPPAQGASRDASSELAKCSFCGETKIHGQNCGYFGQPVRTSEQL